MLARRNGFDCGMSQERPRPAATITHKVAAGASYLVLVTIISRGLGLLNLVVLARILTPTGFGIVGMAMLVIELALTVTDMQIANALLRIKRRDRSLYDTAFTFAFGRGVITALVVIGLAWPAAIYFDERAVIPVIIVLAFVPLIDGLRSPRFVEFAREVDYSKEAIMLASARVAASAIMVSVGIVTGSYWALVAGTVAASVVAAMISHLYRPYRPSFSITEHSVFLGFGGWMTLAAATNYIGSRAASLIIGAYFTAATFGIFNLGLQMATLITSQVAEPFQRALFAGLAKADGEAERKSRAYLLAQSTILGLVLPLGLGAALAAHELVIILAGAKWLEAVQVLQFLAPVLALTTLSAAAQAMLMADGEVRAIFQRNAAALLVNVPLLFVGVELGGLRGVLVASAIASVVFIMLTLGSIAKHYAIRTSAVFVRNKRIVLAGIAMVFAVSFIPSHGTDLWQNLAVLLGKATVGALVYVGILALGWRMAGRPEGVETTVLGFAQTLLMQPLLRRGGG